MVTIKGIRVMDVDEPRPFVPLAIRYSTSDGGRHETVIPALADSGATSAVIPAQALPPGVPWEQLTPTDQRINGVQFGAAIRIWHADLFVCGVRISQRTLVTEPTPESGRPMAYGVVGLADFFRAFSVTYHWANVPPMFTLEPVGQVTPQPDATIGWSINGRGEGMSLLATIHAADLGQLAPAAPSRAARRALARAERTA